MRPGEERDFRAFVDRSLPRLRALAGALTGDTAASDELLGSILGTLARRWHRLESTPDRYAVRLLYRAYAGRRTPITVPAHRLSPPTGEPVAAEPGRRGAGAGGHRDDRAPGYAALGQLPPRSRALLVLRYFDDCDDAAAAAVLGTSATAVTGEITAALEQAHEAWSRAVGGELPAGFDLEAELRARLGELAEAVGADPAAASAAELTSIGLAHGLRATRQRLGMGIGVGAAATVGVLALAAGLLLGGGEPPGATTEPESGTLTLAQAGQSVVSSYFDGQDTYVLDPQTGQYHRWSGPVTATAPDLRSIATVRVLPARSEVRVWSVPGWDRVTAVDLPGPAQGAAWSPDGEWLAVAMAGLDDPWFSEIALVEVDSGTVEMVELAVPTGRAATWYASGAGVSWLDPQRLAVPTGETDRLLPPWRPGHAEAPLVDAIGVFDRDGDLLEEVPIDLTPLAGVDRPHSQTGWRPYGFLADGRCVFTRRPEPGSFYVAAEPLLVDPAPYEAVRVPLPEPAPLTIWSTAVGGAFGSTVLLTATEIPDLDHPDVESVGPFEGERLTYFADFTPTGPRVEQVDLATALPLPVVPGPGFGLTFGDADWLSPAARHLAFTR